MSALCAFSLTACGQASGSASASQGEEVSKELSENKAASSGNPQDVPQQTVQGSNVLIAYFSFPEDVDPAGADAVSGASIVVRNGEKLGSVEYVAKTVQETIGGDLFRIETVQQYPLDHDPLVDQAADEKARAFRPELATHIENLQQYDTILLGYPNWWGDLPMPVYSFLEEYDLSGKTIIPFVTHGGSGFSGTWDTISGMQPGAAVSENTLSLPRDSVSDSEAEIRQWAESLGIRAAQTADVMSGVITDKEQLAFPLGQEIASDSFTGAAYIAPMITEDEVYHFPATNNVTFAPGARSSWHTHGGMVILVTGGVGYYQEEGQPAQIIRKGDVIQCAPGVRHWHGAAPDSWFSQMVIFDADYTAPEGEAQEESVTDEYYANLVAQEYAGRVVSADNGFMFRKAGEALVSDTFSGPAYVSSIVEGENVAGAPGLHYVVFDPGVINNWHTHEGGQILIATDGIGYHQIEGQPVEVLYPGDVAFCPPGVKHWHGGSANTEFAHIAVNTNPELTGLEWFERISEEEYSQLPTEKPDEE